MIAFKGFNKDLTCRGYKFSETEVNKEERAKTVSCGFHCALNPLDCLSYYPNMNTSVYYKVAAEGDINEDGTDTKIACTELRLLEKLNIQQFVLYAAQYIIEHPEVKNNGKVYEEKGCNMSYDFVIVRGKNPVAAGRKNGVIIMLFKEYARKRQIKEAAVYIVGDDNIKPGVYYDIKGRAVENG